MARVGVGALALSVLLAACADRERDSDAPDGDVDHGSDGAPIVAGRDGSGVDAGWWSLDGSVPPLLDATTPASDATLGTDGTIVPLVDAAGCQSDCGDLRPGFALDATGGSAPLSVRAMSSATALHTIVETTYDWGEGDGETVVAHHRYGNPGTYQVVQRVRDARGQTASVSASLTVGAPLFTPVRFSRTDRSSCAASSARGDEVEFTNWGPCGIRTDASILPGSGVFYFEAHRYTPRYRGGGVGLATAAARLEEQVGASAESAGALAWGPVHSAGGTCNGEIDSGLPDLGVVIDYRASSPVIYFLQRGPSGAASVRASCTMAVSTPLFGFYSGDRSRVGYEVRFNTGADTTNAPFFLSADEVRAALGASSDPTTASALVMGFGKTHAGPADSAPVLTVPESVNVALGAQVTLEGRADDAEDGPLSNRIVWLDAASEHHAPVTGKGKVFTFLPSTLGLHPVVATVEDADGVRTSKTVLVKVAGTLPQFTPVQLTYDSLTGPGITLSPDGLSATFRGTSKDGIRANQGIYGKFWYFEVHRDAPIRNMGMGLVTQNGALNPYQPSNVPWSCSLNVMRGFWVNLIEAGDWTKSPTDIDYGFAVDYRGQNPIVYILISGALQGTLRLDRVWEPLYPMLYGNPEDAPPSGPDMTLNFGTKPFAYDPRAILSANGVDASALELGWGLTPATAP